MRNAYGVGFVALAAALCIGTFIAVQSEAAPLSEKKNCIKTFCKQQKRQCASAFKDQFKSARDTCKEFKGKARKGCKRDKRKALAENKSKCNAASNGCTTCCKDPEAGSCRVAVFGDHICSGSTVAGEQCDGDDDSVCPGACRPDCTCPPVSTSTTTLPAPTTTTLLPSPATTTTQPATTSTTVVPMTTTTLTPPPTTTTTQAPTTTTTTGSTASTTTQTTTTTSMPSTTTTTGSTTTTSTTIPGWVEQLRAGNLITANALCRLAAADDPANSPVNLCAALTGLFVDVLETPTLTDVAPSFGFQHQGTAAAICDLSVAYEGIPLGAPRTGTILAAARGDVIPLVDEAMTYLVRIPADAIIHFDPENLPTCVRLPGIGEVEIDSGDLLVLRALLDGVAGITHFAAAYDGDFDLADAVNNRRSPKYVFDNDPGLFTLRNGVGKTELGLARTRFDAALDAFIEAIDFIGKGNESQSDDVLVIAPGDRDAVDLARLVAEKLQTALTGEATFEASMFPFSTDQRLSLAKLFDGEVTNLRPFFGFDDAGHPDVCLLPDPTFGNLAPDMTGAEMSRLLCQCDDPSRTIFAGGPFTQACRQFDGDQASCEAAWALSYEGPASCFFDSGVCSGCGPSNQEYGVCANTCVSPPSCDDPSRTIFAGGPGTEACHQFDGDQASCEAAYLISGSGGPASCFYAPVCSGCGPSNQGQGLCTNTCMTPP